MEGKVGGREKNKSPEEYLPTLSGRLADRGALTFSSAAALSCASW